MARTSKNNTKDVIVRIQNSSRWQLRAKLFRLNAAAQLMFVTIAVAALGAGSYGLGVSRAASINPTWTISFCYRQNIIVTTSRNHTHPCVKAIQTMLTYYGGSNPDELGSTCRNSGVSSIDGNFGSGSASATRCFQSHVGGISVDGGVGRQTYGEMNHWCGKPRVHDHNTRVAAYCS